GTQQDGGAQPITSPKNPLSRLKERKKRRREGGGGFPFFLSESWASAPAIWASSE
ncbi:uncharacterized, partial [Tachysurus ichikawai]